VRSLVTVACFLFGVLDSICFCYSVSMLVLVAFEMESTCTALICEGLAHCDYYGIRTSAVRSINSIDFNSDAEYAGDSNLILCH
jgi:TctA family transporter